MTVIPTPKTETTETEVQDTYLVGGPDLRAMSGSIESDRVIQMHFRRKATDDDRKWLLEAINAKIAADQESPAQCGVQNGDAPQLDRVFIGQGEYVRADQATKTIMDLQRNLRHWREECGKLHAKLSSLVPSAHSPSEAGK